MVFGFVAAFGIGSGMLALALVYGTLGVLVVMGLLTVVRDVLQYRMTGTGHARARRESRWLLAGAGAWGGVGLLLFVAWVWMHETLLNLAFSDLVVPLLPVVLGWGPAVLLWVLAWPETPGYRDQAPRWLEWMDALWMG